MKNLSLICILLNLLISSGCSKYYYMSRNEILNEMAITASKIDVGMTKDEVLAAIGEPDAKNMFSQEDDMWESVIYTFDEYKLYYPANLVEQFKGYFEGWYYDYRLGAMEYAVLYLYFNRQNTLIGLSVKKRFKPDSWDQLIAEKERKAQPVRQLE